VRLGEQLIAAEYIIAKSITRTGAVSLEEWNKNWHDHKQEIATGRVQVHDLPPDKAKEVADLVSTTDGIIFPASAISTARSRICPYTTFAERLFLLR